MADFFDKELLQNGMVVETRDGQRFIVVGNRLMGQYESMSLDNYTNDLWAIHNVFDKEIEKIYESVLRFKDVTSNNLRLVWQRKHILIKEVTMAEVEEKFGCKVKIIND